MALGAGKGPRSGEGACGLHRSSAHDVRRVLLIDLYHRSDVTGSDGVYDMRQQSAMSPKKEARFQGTGRRPLLLFSLKDTLGSSY